MSSARQFFGGGGVRSLPIRFQGVEVFAECSGESSAYCSLSDAQQPSQGEALLQVDLQRSAPHQQHVGDTRVDPDEEEEERFDFTNNLNIDKTHIYKTIHDSIR